MQSAVIHAFGFLKRACAEVNQEHYGLESNVAKVIVQAATEVSYKINHQLKKQSLFIVAYNNYIIDCCVELGC